MAERYCPFCRLNEPRVTVYADDVLQAIVSRAPINRFHLLIIPRVHVERLSDLPAATAAAAIQLAQVLGRAIAAAAHPDGITYLTEDDLSGHGYNLVAHWKLHVIPRFRDEAVRIDWHREPDPGEDVRADIASTIRDVLAAAHLTNVAVRRAPSQDANE